MEASLKEKVDYYIKKLETDDDAFYSLIQLPAEAIPILIEKYKKEDDTDKRREFIEIVWEIRDRGCLEFLFECLNEEDKELYGEALNGIVTLGQENDRKRLTEYLASIPASDPKHSAIVEAIDQTKESMEIKFIESIDTRNIDKISDSEMKYIITRSSTFSENAVLMVIFCLVANDGDIDRKLQYLGRVKEVANSEILNISLNLAEKLISGKEVGSVDVNQLLDLSKSNPGSYNALGLVDIADSTKSELIEEIINEWKKV